jgi:octaheme c-type cytochrome (tetrathionate reductase family)
MKKAIIIIVALNFLILIAINIFRKEEPINLHTVKLKQQYAMPHVSSVDHSKLAALQKDFKTPQEVTEACNSCHTETHKEVMASSHWNWERAGYVVDRGIVFLGKKNALNNFCLGSQTNEQACAKCHIGFGMTSSKNFNYNNARNVDCMVCHDNSETYLKGSSMAGYPDRSINLEKVAQSVGMPKRSNCGSCHFYSGGGNNVKHGDLEEATLTCSRDVDVHMSASGGNLECTACHTAENHKMKGKLYSVSSDNYDRSTCEQCHGTTPHFNNTLNKHFDKVACQTCHIPTYAKENATKMSWKWSDAGKLKDGKPFELEDSMGNHNYMSIKGSFTWAKNVKPDYVWFNGTAGHYLLGDKITKTPVQINSLNGSYADPESKIYPVKIHRGDQIYDKVNNYLVQPKLYSPNKGDSAYWADFDWKLASEAGMKAIGLPFSGQYGFIETEMYWPVNHMVAPKEQALQCAECHKHDNGRLANLAGLYMPGRDRSLTLDFIGKWMLLLSIFGVVIHNSIRILSAYRKKQVETKNINYSENE